MPLQIQTVTRDDLADIASLDCLAMKDAAISKTIWKVQAEEGIDVKASQMAYFATAMSHHGDTYWKVVDTETNELVSVGKFVFQYHEGEEDLEAKEKDAQRKEQEGNQRVAEMFRCISRVPRKFAADNYNGKPHAYLSYLATHPSHERRGAATMLLKQGIAIADAAGLPFYLFASVMGSKQYAKYGFEEIETELVDLSQFGVGEADSRTYMKRAARGSKGE